MHFDWHKHYPQEFPKTIDLSHYKNIPQAISDACHKFSERPALTCMGTTITYRQMDRLSSQFASYLQRRLGVAKGDRVAVMLPNIMQFPVVFLAIQKIGAISVNTNPQYTPREMLHQFKDSGAKTIVIIDLFAHKLEDILEETEIKDVIITSIADQMPPLKALVTGMAMRFKGLIPKHGIKYTSFNCALRLGRKEPYQKPEISHDDTCLLQYTGGTTGFAKGAELTHANLLANTEQIRIMCSDSLIEGQERVLTALPLYHIFSLTVNLLTFLRTGQQLLLVPKPIPIENTVEIFKKYDVTVVSAVNTLYNALNNSKKFQELAPRTVKFAIAGGMALQQAVAKKWQDITGTRIVEGFGLTEASPVTHGTPISVVAPAGSIGIPLSSTIAKIVDEQGQEVPIGDIGELLIKGPQVMKGYWQQHDATKQTIKDGWLFTGDIAKVDSDGFFYIVDRKKDMIIVSGFNVYPNEVEDVIVRHPKVLECAVVGIPDRQCGEAVKAFIVKKDHSLEIAEIKSFCRENLTGYKCPRYFEFMESLPKSNVGKILRKDLRVANKPAERIAQTP
jgi:long-chain acyl-CoA synthetase